MKNIGKMMDGSGHSGGENGAGFCNDRTASLNSIINHGPYEARGILQCGVLAM